MDLIGKIEKSPLGDLLVVEQHGGYTTENTVVLRSIGKGRYWTGKQFRSWDGSRWVFGMSQGALISLQQAADLIDANLELSSELSDLRAQSDAKIKAELATRTLLQKYMDDSSLNLTPYMSREVPKPWRHQQIAYHWAMRMEAMYIHHKPGLGKTRTGADIARGRMNAEQIRPPEQFILPPRWSQAVQGQVLEERWGIRGGILIVCPKVVMGTWQEELVKWQGMPSQIISGHSRAKKLRQAGMVSPAHICTYGSLDCVEGNEYDLIIGDELHNIASEDTLQWARMCELRKTARYVLGLSGTPLSNMLPSLWSQYFWLDGGRTLGSTYEDYKRRYFDGGRKLEAKEGAQDLIAGKIARISYPLTMTEAFPDKKLKIHQVQKIAMTKEQITYYKRVRDSALVDIMTGTVSTDIITTKLTRLQQICQGWVPDDNGTIHEFTSAKMTALMAMLTGDGDLASERVLIWCRFKRDRINVIKRLRAQGINTLELYGDMSVPSREATKHAWNNDYRYRCFVGMIQMGIGINLHAPNCVDAQGEPDRAHTTVFYGMDWRVVNLEQAMDRVYRGDQVETCLYRYLLSEEIPGMFEDGEPLRPLDVKIFDNLQLKLEQGVELADETIEYIRSLLTN